MRAGAQLLSSSANWVAKKSSKPRESSVVKPSLGGGVGAPLSSSRRRRAAFAFCRADRDGVVPQYAPSSRGVAQPGRALRSGRRGRRFKSYHPDQFQELDQDLTYGRRLLRKVAGADFALVAFRALPSRLASFSINTRPFATT